MLSPFSIPESVDTIGEVSTIWYDTRTFLSKAENTKFAQCDGVVKLFNCCAPPYLLPLRIDSMILLDDDDFFSTLFAISVKMGRGSSIAMTSES